MRKSNQCLVTTQEHALKMSRAQYDQRSYHLNILSWSRRTHSRNPRRNYQRNLPLQIPNQAFQPIEDKVFFKLDWSTKSKSEHHQRSVAFADRSNSDVDNSRLLEKLEALTIKIDSQFQSLKEEMHEMCKNYNNRGGDYASKNDDTLLCERHEANYIQSEEYQNQDSHDSYSHQTYHDRNDSEKSLTKLNNDVRNNLEDFKRCIHSMRTVHWKLFARDDGKTTGVLPKKNSKPINQELQSKTDFKKLMTKFLDD
ncbi:hypothetical protein Tco_0720051 [Tanacetum coccineum]